MLKVKVSEDEKAQLREASRAEDASWWFREQIETALLSSAGRPPPQIAGHLGWSPKTVRPVLNTFAAKGLDGLPAPLRKHPRKPKPEIKKGYASRTSGQRHIATARVLNKDGVR